MNKELEFKIQELLNFIDWYSPSKEVSERMKNTVYILKDSKEIKVTELSFNDMKEIK